MSRQLNVALSVNSDASELLRCLKTAVLLGDSVTLYSVRGIAEHQWVQLHMACEEVDKLTRSLVRRDPSLAYMLTDRSPAPPLDALELHSAVESGLVRIPDELQLIDLLEPVADALEGDALFERVASVFADDVDDGRIEAARIFRAAELLREDVASPGTYAMVDYRPQESAPDAPESPVVGEIAIQAAHLLFRDMDFVERASVSELADIRQHLAAPLVDFRAALVDLAIAVAQLGETEDLEHRIDHLIRRDIEPAIQHARELVGADKYLLSLVKNASAEKVALPTSIGGLGLAAATWFGAPSALAIAAAGFSAASVAVAGAASTAWLDYVQPQRENKMVFVVKAERRARAGSRRLLRRR